MRKMIWLTAAAAALALGIVAVAVAGNGSPIDTGSANVLTLAVYGDSPYGTSNADTAEFQATPAFIDAVNNDPKVDLVAHVGDIHSGSQRCTQAYDQSVFDLWTQFKDPLVYTPGDNEWSDCQKTKELAGDPSLSYAGGDPFANLALVRSIFFPNPGYTLGGRKKQVISQAQVGTGTDANYVENVMWEQSKTVFVTVNIPGGSNDDADNWFGHARTQVQTDEIAQREQANLHWLDAAFAQAEADGAKAVVIFEQSDMWDTSDTAAHESNYGLYVAKIAADTTAFGKPVLLFNGDSHLYRSDNPLVQSSACAGEPTSHAPEAPCTTDAWSRHPGYNVPNFHRVIVHGSTPLPLEYLRLTVDPRADNATTSTTFGPFSWERIEP
jgi:Calcineurin-like phosphoesterase